MDYAIKKNPVKKKMKVFLKNLFFLQKSPSFDGLWKTKCWLSKKGSDGFLFYCNSEVVFFLF